MRKEEKKRGKFPGATRWPHDTIFLLVKVAIRAAVVSLYNANAASVHNVATRSYSSFPTKPAYTNYSGASERNGKNGDKKNNKKCIYFFLKENPLTPTRRGEAPARAL